MLETLMMAGSLAVLGYAFYISSRMFWSSRSDRGSDRLVYGAASAFIIVAYGIFALVLFSFVTSFLSSPAFFDALNMVLGVLLLSGSGLISALMKYHLSSASRQAAEEVSQRAKIPASSGRRKHPKDGEAFRLAKEVESLKKELSEARTLNKLAVGRELRMVELKKRIAQLEKK